MSDDYGDNDGGFTQEEIDEFDERARQRQRVLVLADVISGVARDARQERYEKFKDMQSRRSDSTNSQQNFTRGDFARNSGNIQYKSAQIHDPTTGQVKEVTVIEDSACRVNFISPGLARVCNLTAYSSPPITHATMTTQFTSSQRTEVTWLGKNNKNGSDWFYIAPENAPIEVLVGTEFMRDHPGVFESRALLEPALLNVQVKMKKDEQSQIQTNEAVAHAQAAELENRKKQAKQQHGQHKQKQTGSSSRSSRSKKP